MFQLWKIHGVMKCGWSIVTCLTSTSNSWKSLRFCFSRACCQRNVTASPRLPVSSSRTVSPASSGSPCSSSRSSSRCDWSKSVRDAAQSAALARPASGTGIVPRQNMLIVNSARMAAK